MTGVDPDLQVCFGYLRATKKFGTPCNFSNNSTMAANCHQLSVSFVCPTYRPNNCCTMNLYNCVTKEPRTEV